MLNIKHGIWIIDHYPYEGRNFSNGGHSKDAQVAPHTKPNASMNTSASCQNSAQNHDSRCNFGHVNTTIIIIHSSKFCELNKTYSYQKGGIANHLLNFIQFLPASTCPMLFHKS
jgi:hypothetical protein